MIAWMCHNENDLDNFTKMNTNNGQRIDNNTKQDKDKSTKIIRSWEELQLKRNICGLVHEKEHDNLFHILDYFKHITFVSGGFLDDVDMKTKLEDNDMDRVQDVDQDANYDVDVDVVKDDQYDDVDVDISIVNLLDVDYQLDEELIHCQHYHWFGPDESKCFDLHPCGFCGKSNNLLNMFQKNKKVQWKHIHFECLGN